nr:MAG: polyprotein (methyl transferase, alkylated DNA repair protein, helicase, RdRP) [Tomato vitivirus 1]
MSISVLSQRAAAASLYQNGSTDEIGNIKTLKSERLYRLEKNSDGLFDYYVSDFLRDYFSSKGVHTSVHSFQAHPHPCSKMIENHLLYNIVNQYVDSDTLFMSCKESKLKTLFTKKGLKNPTKTSQYNRVIHAKDVLRYSNPYRNLNLGHLPEIREWSKRATTLFVHDEVQYWSLSDLQKVLGQLVRTDRVLYSIVYPPELAAGFSESFFPEAYKFELNGDYFTWYPDGNADGAYKQPVNEWLLTTSKTIDTEHRSWTITKLITMGSHHLFLASLGSQITEDSYVYDDFTVIQPNDVLRGARRQQGKLMRSRYVQGILYYLLALKKPDANSAIAKMRQMTRGDENASEALFVAQLSRQIQDTKLYDSMGNFRAKEAIWEGISRALGSNLTYFFDKKRYDVQNLENFILRCEPATLRVDRCFRDLLAVRTTIAPIVDGQWFGAEDEEWRVAYWAHLQSMDAPSEPYELVGEREEQPSQIVEPRLVSHLGLINCARMEFEEDQKVVYELGQSISITPNDGFKGMKKFLRRTGVCTGVETLGLPWIYDPLTRFELKLINGEQLERELFGKSGEKPTTIVEERGIDKCPCGIEFQVKHLDLERYVENCERLGEMDNLKGRRAVFFSRRSSEYVYNGGSHKSKGWPEWLDEVSEALGLSDDFDHCLLQVYKNGATIGYHADDEECYKDAEVVTLNIKGEAEFSIKCTKEMKKKLGPCDVLVMPKGTQSNHKHSVRSLTEGRISLTFRNGIVGPDAGSDDCSSYEEENPGFDESLEILRQNSKYLCCIDIIAEHMRVSREICACIINSKMPRVIEEIKEGGLSISTLLRILGSLDIAAYIQSDRGCVRVEGGHRELCCYTTKEHISIYTGPRMEATFENALLYNSDLGVCNYMVSEHRAKLLIESFQEGFTGVRLNKFQKGKHVLGSANQDEDIKVYTSFGFAGSGKSHYAQTLLSNGAYKDTLVIVPRKALCIDWRNKVHKDVVVCTFENVFVQKQRGFTNIVVDEIGLLPHGYIDLLHGTFNYETLLLLGDPLQCGYYSKSDDVFLAPIKESVFRLIRGACTYLYKTHRLPKEQPFFEIEAHGASSPEYLTFNDRVKDDAKIVASRKRKETEGEKASTISESQGLSLQRANLMLDNDWGLLEDETVMVALTRARRQINICVGKQVKERLVKHAKSNLLRMVLQGRRISKHMINDMLKTHLGDYELITKEARMADTDEMEDKLAGDPYLKGLLSLLVDDEVEEPEIPDEYLGTPEKTHLPLSAGTNEVSISDLKSKEEREVINEAGQTEQIDELGYKGESENPMTHKALYLHHKNSDAATFMMSVKKRLVFRDPEKNRRKYNKCAGFGKQLFLIFKQTYGLVQPNSLPDLSAMEAAFTKKRIAKSQKLIEKHSYRSDPDWPSNYLKIFLKQQVCTKMEKRGVDAKAGQTIACFSHAVLCKFGPQLRRTEKALRDQLGPNVMIYSQKNYTDLDQWSRTYVDYMLGTDSDYEAFDRSQDEKILSFEVEVLKFFLWPEELINEYVELKLMMGCTMGDLAIMRFSGEFGTFFFNTICNMAFTCLRYSISKDTPICYAGDDMFAPGVLEVKEEYEHVLKELKLKAKVNVSESPLFCGWRMTPYGIVKDPNLLLDRWKIAKRDGKLDQCRINYALEAVYGYRLGEHLHEINIDIDAQQELVREIVLCRDKLPKGVARLFSRDPEECFSDGEELSFRISSEAEYLGDVVPNG